METQLSKTPLTLWWLYLPITSRKDELKKNGPAIFKITGVQILREINCQWDVGNKMKRNDS